VKVWTLVERAYLAGIIDGEGSLVLRNNGTHRFGRALQIGNTSLPLLEWIQSRFGGTVSFEKRPNPKHKPIYRWFAAADDIDAILEAVLPFLLVKTQQAHLLLAYSRTLGPKIHTKRSTNDTPVDLQRERFRIHRELRVLNKRGIA
jgi:LAGLIDADG-like domain